MFGRYNIKKLKEGSSYDKMFVDQNKHRKEEPSLDNIIQHFEEKIIRELQKILDNYMLIIVTTYNIIWKETKDLIILYGILFLGR